MKIISILFLLGIIYHTSYAQTVIHGKVANQQGEPIVGTLVFLTEQNKGTICDENGEYQFENLPTGLIKIEFSSMGYNTLIKSLVIQGKENILNVSLVESVIETQVVVVTGGSVSSQHENAVKIDVLKSKDIMLSGTPNFMESLTKVPGVDMISKGQGVSKPVIRGLSMNDILVMNNGVRIENYQYSENHPLGVDDNSVDRVEVIKGPASLLYGSDAIGGVVNFIKEKPAATGTIVGDYQTQIHSNTLGLNNSLGVKGASKFLFYGLRASNKTHADYKQGGGDFVPNSRFNEWSLSVNTGYTDKKGTFKVFYDYFKQNLGMTVPVVKPIITEPGRDNNIWYQDLEHHLVSSQNNVYLSRFKWETNIAFQSALRKLQTVHEVPDVEMKLSTITYESKLYLTVNEFSEYIVGIQGKIQTNRNLNNRVSQFLPDADINNFGALALAKFTFFQKLKIQGGFRYDTYNMETFALGTENTTNYHPAVLKKYASLNGSIGATFSLSDKLFLRANLAKAFRVPNLSELTSNGMHGSRYEIGNAKLEPENAYESDLSMHYHGEFLSYDLAVFYNHIKDYIYISPTADTTEQGVAIFRFSQTNANLYGGEAVIHFHPKSLPWLHLKGIYSNITAKQDNDDYLPFIPAQKFRYELRVEKASLSFFNHPNISISALTALKQDNPSPYETETNGYTLFNIGFNTEIKLLHQLMVLGFSINNIFDNQYFDHLSTLKPMNYYNQGRNISLTLKIPFGIK